MSLIRSSCHVKKVRLRTTHRCNPTATPMTTVVIDFTEPADTMMFFIPTEEVVAYVDSLEADRIRMYKRYDLLKASIEGAERVIMGEIELTEKYIKAHPEVLEHVGRLQGLREALTTVRRATDDR